MTTFGDGLYQWGGVPVGSASIPTTSGNTYFVNGTTGAGSNGNSGKGLNSAWSTLEYAYSQVIDGNDDIICLVGSTAQTLSAMLTVAKSRVHFIGLDAGARMFGQSQRITLTATSGASNIATILNTGTYNTFQNLLIDSSSSVAQGLYAFIDGGTDLQMVNCRMVITSQLDQTGAAATVLNGTRSQYNRCTFGSQLSVIVGAIIRPSILATSGISAGGAKCTDTIIEDSQVWYNCVNTANRLVYAAGATDIVRSLQFKSTGFVNNFGASAVPAQAIAAGATQTAGAILLDPNCYALNVTKVSTTTGVIVTGPAVAAGAGIGINAA